MRALPVALLLTVALIGAGCGGGDKPAAAERTPEARETHDAAELFVELPRGLKYRPAPKNVRDRMRKLFPEAHLDDMEVRQILRDDGAAAIAVGLVASEEMVMEDVAAGIEDVGGKVAAEDIDGVPFHVGVDAYGNFLAVRSHGNAAFSVYAATRKDARSFARPFAQHLTG